MGIYKMFVFRKGRGDCGLLNLWGVLFFA